MEIPGRHDHEKNLDAPGPVPDIPDWKAFVGDSDQYFG
jgi:hypothetical protein